MVYVFLADGFEDIEAITPIDMLKRAGLEVKTVGVTGKNIVSTYNMKVEADITIDMVDNDSIDAIVLPGGMPGTINLGKSKTLRGIINYAMEKNKLICAICAAPTILGEMGLLKGRDAVCYPKDIHENRLIGANILSNPVAIDGNIITAKGAGVSHKFAFEIISRLVSREVAQNVLSDMLYE